MKKAIAKGAVGMVAVMAVVCLTTLVFAEDFGSIAGGGMDYSGDSGATQESAGPVNFQSAGQAMESTADTEQAQANAGEEKLQIMSANKPLMDEYGHLNGNMQSGDTGYYKDFPVVYNYESGKGYTFSVQYSINGYQTGDGTQPFTKDFTCGRSKQVGSTLKQVKDFIETRTDPAKAIVPAGTSQYVPSTEDMDRVNEGQDSWLDRIYADASNYCGFQYSVYTMGFDAESHVYYQQNGVEKEEFYSSDAFGDTYAIVEAHAQNFILDNALIKPPIVTAK